jgi:hypothetical protein
LHSRLAGVLTPLLVALLATSAIASTIIQNPTLLPGSVRWSFSTATNTFSNDPQGVDGLPDGLDGIVSMQALFDELGNFQSGSFEMRRADDTLLLLGNVTGHEPFFDSGSHFRIIFNLDFTFASPLLGYPAHFGDWEAYVCNGSDGDCKVLDSDEPLGPTSVEGVFTTDYVDASYPVYHYIHTFAIRVPYPTPFVLIGTTLAVLASSRGIQWRRRRRH